MNAKKIRKTLDYLPRWAWYLISFFVGGPIGLLVVYLVFHVLKKMEQEQNRQTREDTRRQAASARRTAPAMDDREVERRWRETEDSAARVQAQRSRAKQSEPLIADDATIDDVIRAVSGALRDIREANDIIADEPLSAQIDSIETSCRQILSILEQRPQLLSQLVQIVSVIKSRKSIFDCQILQSFIYTLEFVINLLNSLSVFHSLDGIHEVSKHKKHDTHVAIHECISLDSKIPVRAHLRTYNK